MTPEIWIALAAANFVSAVSPGQNVALVGSSTARGGLVGGMAATGGILVAEGVWSLLALLLVIGARDVSPLLWTVLHAGSGLFLVVYGIASLRKGPAAGAGGGGGCPHRGRVAVRGFWIGLANPLTLVFFASMFPLFVASDVVRISPALFAFCASAVVLSAAVALAPYVVLSDQLARRGLGRVLERASAGALILLGGAVMVRVAC